MGGGRGGGGGEVGGTWGEEGWGEGYSDESWSVSMGRASLCHSTGANRKSVFIGDTGQGDVLAADELMQAGELDFAVMHVVAPVSNTRESGSSKACPDFVNNYVEAARKAYIRGYVQSHPARLLTLGTQSQESGAKTHEQHRHGAPQFM